MARAPVTPLLYNLVMKIIFEGPGTRVGIVEHELKAHGIEVRYERPEERRGIEPIEAVQFGDRRRLTDVSIGLSVRSRGD